MNHLINLLTTLVLALGHPAQASLDIPSAADPGVAITISVPDGFRSIVASDGCQDDRCPYGRTPANYYDAETRTAVLYLNQSAETTLHEACHAHQHETVLVESGREPTIDLREWYATTEGRGWMDATAGSPMPWDRMSARNGLEDFAMSCAAFLVRPDWLRATDFQRYAAVAWLLGF